jgi:hypothetical protein
MRKLIIILSAIILGYVISFATPGVETEKRDTSIIRGKPYTLPLFTTVKSWTIEEGKDSIISIIIQSPKTKNENAETRITGNAVGSVLIFGIGQNGNDTIVKYNVAIYETVSSYFDTIMLTDDINTTIQTLLQTPKKTSKSKQNLHLTEEDKILLYIIIVITIAIICLSVYLISDKKKRRDEILYTLTGLKKGEYDGSRQKKWENEIVQVKYELKCTISDLQRRIDALENANRNRPEPAPVSIQKPAPHEQIEQPRSQPKTLYANAIINGVFNRVTDSPNADTVYELLRENTHARFTIYKNSYDRVISCSDLLEGCDTQRMNSTPSSLEVENGIASCQDGKWQITKKAKVKFV